MEFFGKVDAVSIDSDYTDGDGQERVEYRVSIVSDGGNLVDFVTSDARYTKLGRQFKVKVTAAR